MEEDDISLDNEMTLNSSITEGAVTRALYGDEEGIGICCIIFVTMVTCLTFHRIDHGSR